MIDTQIDNHPIETSESVRFLGVEVDEKLTWKARMWTHFSINCMVVYLSSDVSAKWHTEKLPYRRSMPWS